MKELCSMFGPNSVSFLTIDDKANVPLGIAAASKQAPILIHLEYRVSLPDHAFSVGSRHKLIPSVMSLCTIAPYKFSEALSYSGLTYRAIRSRKHDTTNPFTHGKDFESALALPEFQEHVLNDSGKVKPILFFATDEGSDENPRFPNT